MTLRSSGTARAYRARRHRGPHENGSANPGQPYTAAMRARRAVCTITVLALSACGNSAGGHDPDASTDGDTQGSGDGGDGWSTLISRSWTVQHGTEAYRCRRMTVTQDMNITGFRARAPVGPPQ